MTAKLTFYGGAGTVTGANFLLEWDSARILVDCGALQREKTCVPENAADFPYDPASITALFITHAHQDHIGRVPRLVQRGFRGPIYSTAATKELAAIMFDDALRIMTDESQRYDCPPIYTAADVSQTMMLWRTHAYHEPFPIDDATVEFLDAGHILGSAMIRFSRAGKSILFTGDLGNPPEPLLRDTESPEGANYLIMESVYGDRVHEDRASRRSMLRDAIERTRAQKGTLLIPSFSLERTQILLFEMSELIQDGGMQPLPVYLDSPLAERASEVFTRHIEDLNADAQAHGRHLLQFPGLSVTANTQESRAIHDRPDPKIIIAGAGMSSGGRIRAHEMRYLPDPKASVLLVGYQAPGSLGRRIQDGARSVTIDGQPVSVRARISMLSGYSGHADRDQLIAFVERAGHSLEKTFIVMGEPKASAFLAQRVHDFLDVQTHVPGAGEAVTLEW